MSTITLELSDADVDRIAEKVAAKIGGAASAIASDSSAAPRWLTLDEVAAALRCSPRQVRRLVAAGRLRASKLNSTGSSRVLIAHSEVERLIAEART